MTDLEAIPDFLLVDQAESARRRAWAAAHPIVALNFSGETATERRDADEARERMKAEQKELDRQLAQAVRDRKREAAGITPHHVQDSQPSPDMLWNPKVGKWVLPNYISATKHDRILRELPTDNHRQIFVKLYGPGRGVSLGAGGSPACATKDVRKVGAAPAGVPTKVRSAVKGAARVRVPSGPRGASPATAARSTIKAPRATAGVDWKAGMLTMLARPEGVTLTEIGIAYGWQEKSASARLSGIRKERTINVAVEDRGRVYRTKESAP